jgi:hypothetical protein
MKTIGSQKRETIEEAGLTVVNYDTETRELTVRDSGEGKLELWAENDHFAGYVIEYMGKGYEFVRPL